MDSLYEDEDLSYLINDVTAEADCVWKEEDVNVVPVLEDHFKKDGKAIILVVRSLEGFVDKNGKLLRDIKIIRLEKRSIY